MGVKSILAAVGLALLVMVLNVAAAFAWVAVYSMLIEPGHSEAWYQAYAMRAAPVSSVFAGLVLMLGAGVLIGRGRPVRQAMILGAVMAGTYILIDAIVLVAAQADSQTVTWAWGSWVTKLAAAVLGARIGARLRPRSA
jgi:threonine/homoserine/homoserine lactone efflux protein